MQTIGMKYYCLSSKQFYKYFSAAILTADSLPI